MIRNLTRTLAFIALLTAALGASGAKPETPPPGMGKYVVVSGPISSMS